MMNIYIYILSTIYFQYLTPSIRALKLKLTWVTDNQRRNESPSSRAVTVTLIFLRL